jgi:hypothetical protein
VTASPPEEDDATVSVDRASDADEDDATIAVDRASEEPADSETGDGAEIDATLAVRSRGGSHDSGIDAADDTIAVTRAPFSPPPGEEGHDTTVALGRLARGNRLARPQPRHRRRGIKPPPVPEGFAPLPVEGLGAWGVEEYPARSLTAPPVAPVIDADADPPREPDPSLSSVRKHARRSARRAFAMFVASCLVLALAIAGLIAWLV